MLNVERFSYSREPRAIIGLLWLLPRTKLEHVRNFCRWRLHLIQLNLRCHNNVNRLFLPPGLPPGLPAGLSFPGLFFAEKALGTRLGYFQFFRAFLLKRSLIASLIHVLIWFSTRTTDTIRKNKQY